MHCGLPALVVAPEKFLRFVPVAGVLGFFADLPVLGIRLRRFAALRSIRRWGGIALPNRISPHRVMNEKFGNVTPGDAAEEICEELSHPDILRKTSEEFLALSGDSGAAARLCDIASAK